MNVLAFAASNSKHSINRALINHAADVLQAEINSSAAVEYLDINDYEMAIYSIDREQETGIPEQAKGFYQKIMDADALLISYAEHNGLYTAAYKNLFDWTSRVDMKVFQNKPMVIMSASMGPTGGANVLKTALESAPFFAADVRGSFSVGPFSAKFDSEEKRLTDTTLINSLRTSLLELNAK